MGRIAEDPAFSVWQDSQRVGVVDGQVRDLCLKPEVKVSRSQFFQKYGSGLGLGPDDHMIERRTYTDKWGFTQSRFAQQYKGLEVLGADYVLQEKEGGVTYAVGKIVNGLDLDTTSTISESQAFEAAKSAIGAVSIVGNNESAQGKLAISANRFSFSPEGFRLVYRFNIRTKQPVGHWTVDIDAKTAEVVKKLTNRFEFDVPGGGATCYHGPREFTVEEVVWEDNTASYRLRMQGPPEILTLTGPEDAEAAEDIVSESSQFNDPEMIHKMAVTVHWSVQKSVEFYASHFGWIGLDGSGEQKIESRLLTNPTSSAGVYDSKRLFFRTVSDPPDPQQMQLGCNRSVDMIVSGHEFTHGVHDHAVDYVYERESGALAEGFATAFGFLIKAHATGVNWCNAFAFIDWPPDLCKKFWSDTSSDPTYHLVDTYKGNGYMETDGPCTEENDLCYVHSNAHLVLNWLRLLDEGGEGKNDFLALYSVSAIGREKAATVAFLTMTMMPAAATYPDVRLLSIAVAEGLYGKHSSEVIAVTNAWHAVGVGPKHQLDRDCLAVTKEDEWSVRLDCKVFPDEVSWEFEISPSLDFDKDVIKVPSGAISVGGGVKKTWVDVNLDAKTQYFWRFRGKESPSSSGGAGSGSWGIMVKGMGGGRRAPVQNPGKAAPSQPSAAPEAQWSGWSPVQSVMTSSKRLKGMQPSHGSSGHHPWGGEFSWDPVPEAVHYQVQVSETSEFPEADDLSKSGLLAKTSTLPKETFNLKVNKDYYWRVRAIGPGDAEGDWSSVLTFKTGLPVVEMDWPANNASLPPWQLIVRWKTLKAATEYRVIVSSHQDLTSPLVDKTKAESPVATTYQEVVDFQPPGGTFYWGVIPRGPAPYQEWGGLAKRSFVADYQQTKSKALSPVTSINYKQSPVKFVWKVVNAAQSYRLAVYPKNANGTLGAAVLDQTVAGSPQAGQPDSLYWDNTNVATASVNPNGYAWEVQAIGPNNMTGIKSDQVQYPVMPAKPQIVSPANGASNIEPDQDGQIAFVWTHPYANEYPPTNGYVVGGSCSPPFQISRQTSSTSTKIAIPAGSSCNWSVAASGPNGQFASSGISSFTTKAPPQEEQESGGGGGDQPACDMPSVPTILAPVNNPAWSNQYSFVGSPVTFKWTSVSGAVKYKVSIKRFVFGGVPPYVPVSEADYTSTQSAAIPHVPGLLYAVTVKAQNSCGQWGSGSTSQYLVK